MHSDNPSRNGNKAGMSACSGIRRGLISKVVDIGTAWESRRLITSHGFVNNNYQHSEAELIKEYMI